MGMACSKIVAEALTITGSIGVISGKFSLKGLYEKAGYGKTTLSRGRCVILPSSQGCQLAVAQRWFRQFLRANV